RNRFPRRKAKQIKIEVLCCVDILNLKNHVGESEDARRTIARIDLRRHVRSPCYSRVVSRTSMTIDTGCSDEFMVRRASTKVVNIWSACETTLQGMRRLSSSCGSTAPVCAAYHSWSPRPPR